MKHAPRWFALALVALGCDGGGSAADSDSPKSAAARDPSPPDASPRATSASSAPAAVGAEATAAPPAATPKTEPVSDEVRAHLATLAVLARCDEPAAAVEPWCAAAAGFAGATAQPLEDGRWLGLATFVGTGAKDPATLSNYRSVVVLNKRGDQGSITVLRRGVDLTTPTFRALERDLPASLLGREPRELPLAEQDFAYLQSGFERNDEGKRFALEPHAAGFRLGRFDLRRVGAMWVAVAMNDAGPGEAKGLELRALAPVPYVKE